MEVLILGVNTLYMVSACILVVWKGLTVICPLPLVMIIFPEAYKEDEDNDIVREAPEARAEMRECVFSKGQSKRIWNELHKVCEEGGKEDRVCEEGGKKDRVCGEGGR